MDESPERRSAPAVGARLQLPIKIVKTRPKPPSERMRARVLTVRAIDDLTHLTALVTRRYFGSAARG